MILIIGGAFQGKFNFARNVLGIKEDKIFNGLHNHLKEENAEKVLEKIFSGEYEAIICDEVGCGVVPLEKADRLWRERVGRTCCEIAKKCDVVWRVQLGIGTKIKGEDNA